MAAPAAEGSAEKRVASPESLADEIPYPKRIETCATHDTSIDNLPPDTMKIHEESSLASDSDIEVTTPDDDDESSLASDSDSEVTTPDDDEVMPFQSRAYDDYYMIEEFLETPRIPSMADEMVKYNEIVQDLEELLQSLVNLSTDKLKTHVLNHSNKVQNVWRNSCFNAVLLKEPYLPCAMRRFRLVASRNLSAFLIVMIRKDPSFQSIFNYPDTATMMRNALSILIGYWSNEDMLHYLVFSLGSRSLGLIRGYEDSAVSVLKGDNSFAWGEENSEKKNCTESCTSFLGMPDYSPIEDLRQDASIKELVYQLLNNKAAVSSCQEVLNSLQNDVPVKFENLYQYHVRLWIAASKFWLNPHIFVPLIKALKQSTSLVNVFKKYSRGAQLLRCVERMIRIQKDPLLGDVLKSDCPETRVSGALGVIFGYWSNINMTQLTHILEVAKRRTRILVEGDLTKYDIEAFQYIACGPDDVEGLENVLADKYSKHSKEYMDLFNKIVKSRKSKEQNTTEKSSGSWSSTTVLLMDGEVVYIDIDKFPASCC